MSARLATPLLALLFLAGSVASAGPGGVVPVELTDPVSGEPVRIEAGPPALHIVLFATWCQPCLEELRGLRDLETRWGERGYRVVLVAVPTRQTAERLAGFIAENRPPGRVVLDHRGVVSRAAGSDELPHHLVLDRNGDVVLRASRLNDEVVEAVRGLVASRGGRP